MTLSLFFFYLEGSHCLINASANTKVVDGGMLNDSFLVDDEKPSQCNALYLHIAKCFNVKWLKVSREHKWIGLDAAHICKGIIYLPGQG